MRLLVLLVAVGCSGGTDGVTLDDGVPTETGTPTSPTSGPDCDGADTYVDGISATSAGSASTVAIVGADPTPPDVGDNTWTISVDSGGPVTGLAPVIEPWMPLHGHGLVPAEYAGTDLGDGTYSVETFDLIMPGLWEFRVRLRPGEADPDEAVFRLCAEG